MSGYNKTTILDCSRSQSLEARAFNDQNPSQWTNRMGTGFHLKVGDQVSVHSSYISELGCQTGEIQIKGEQLSTTTTKITQYEKLLRDESLPSKYGLINASNTDTTIQIRDDTINLVTSPYKTSNGENYMYLPRRFGVRGGTNADWNQFDQRSRAAPGLGNNPSVDMGATRNPQRPLAVCAADWSEVFQPYSASVSTPVSKICQKNDNKRYTIFTREQTFRGFPSGVEVSVTGKSHLGKAVIHLKHGSTTEGIIVGMTIVDQHPKVAFALTAQVISTTNATITMSENCIQSTGTHNVYVFKVPSSKDDQYLPPTTANSTLTADECEALRDPATLGNYLQVRNLVSTKVIPGYNSPTDIAIQLTEEINDRKEIETLVYKTENKAKNQSEDVAFSSISETDCYKHYHCATATYFQSTYFTEWFKTNGTWNIDEAYNYLANYQNIGIKRPELYIAGCELNASEGLTTNRDGEDFQLETDQVFMTGEEWTETNLLKYKKFFDAQGTYPELFDDYTQNASFLVSVDSNRFIHMNLFDNASRNSSPDAQFAPVDQISLKAPGFGYDLYNSAVSSSNTTFPLFIDYNSNTSNRTGSDVSATDFGNIVGTAGTLTSDYTDLAYGFARKVRRGNIVDVGSKFYIGFQFTRTGNQIPDIFFNTNASTSPPRKELGTGGGRLYGFDRHFTSYGNSVMMLYNGNVNTYGEDRDSNTQKLYAFAQQDRQTIYYLDEYEFGIYLGADNPLIDYDDTQQRFTLDSLHSAEKVGNAYNANFPGTKSVPLNPNAEQDCYKINKRLLNTNFTPEMTPYENGFNASFATNGSIEAYNSMNTNISQYEVFDANSGIFIEDWLCPEKLWNQSLAGIMGFRYDQFNNLDSQSSRQVRIKAGGSSANLGNLNIITTNADVSEGDLIDYSRNIVDSNTFSISNPVAVGGKFFNKLGTEAKDYRIITPAITISPINSVKITAQRLPTKTLRPYYTIRSDILLENNYLGGITSGITLPIVSITNKANPYGDYLNGQGQITFTNTIDRVITNVRCSIHEPDGSFARVDLDSAIIFKVDQQMPATLDLVSELLASKARADKKAAAEIEALGSGAGL